MTAHHFTFQITDESDASDIREVETRAFGFSKEADLTASLLEDESARPALSLLAR
ncbi:N-acetyltransferase, partial [Escherichia coli]|nr:N-acetyltransferase [Escherichia coli]HAO9834173.1 N-acetyltransferase [Escherichia coli O25b:H4-ST131]